MRAIILFCVVALAVADQGAKIIDHQYGIEEDGSYEASYETTNGITANEDGISYPGNEPETGNYVRTGSYSYEWEGVTYTVDWTADENGFHPEGDHLPDFSHTREHIGGVADSV
ncbi:endocuticle structural glycoprotein ABD-4-like [Pollicipes pollicipes]|uniref:endocuticle structural glycoprotein ABD-4-like n=1 Tax=Pollicipes pollicipes TaxID=41117 RepID=UPI0018854255|nr:endocuticle structural glycoprotein ABD-4-like [Pollicipes pollicipes]XP_037080969.1 endocuticle structural glycoprotein ABD-4-like [Pollicipes pollicipes]